MNNLVISKFCSPRLSLVQYHGPGAPINELDSNGCTPLMYAAMADSILAIEMLLNFSARREQVSNKISHSLSSLF